MFVKILHFHNKRMVELFENALLLEHVLFLVFGDNRWDVHGLEGVVLAGFPMARQLNSAKSAGA